ncbi:hypothetical protein ROTAS13_04330 [Roseomonas sp. TAS13]|nr:hypothetical protein ROTAS13_04330 [Roseomonas sp. TAS13]
MVGAGSRDHHRRDLLLPLRGAVRRPAGTHPARADPAQPRDAAAADLERRLRHRGGALFHRDPAAPPAGPGDRRLALPHPGHRHQRILPGRGPGGPLQRLGAAQPAGRGKGAGLPARPVRTKLAAAAALPLPGAVRTAQSPVPAGPRRAAGPERLRPHPVPQRADLFPPRHRGTAGPRHGGEAGAGRLDAAGPCRTQPGLRRLPVGGATAGHRCLPPPPRGTRPPAPGGTRSRWRGSTGLGAVS